MTSAQYEGGIEHWDDRHISGWAYCTAEPDKAVTLDIFINGRLVETLVADTYREDLFLANKGSGIHAFQSSDLTNHLGHGSSLDIIQLFVANSDVQIFRPLYLRNGKTAELKCLFPWTTMTVFANGDVYTCLCPSWLKDGHGVVGNERQQSLDDIWNGPHIKDIRRAFAEGNYSMCREHVCPYLKGDFVQNPPTKSISYAITHTEEQFTAGVEELAHFVDEGCNLSCVMCRPRVVPVNREAGRRAAREIESLAHKGALKQLRIAPAGEALMQPDLVRLLKSRTLSDNGIHTTIITNLTTMSPRLWSDIKHNTITFQCSLDGATKHTYEKIRIGSNWEKVYGNLLFLVDAYKSGALHRVVVNYVVMGANRHDIGGMIRLTQELGIDLFLIKQEGRSVLEENVFDCCDLQALDEIFGEIEEHRGFELPHVNLGPIAGIMNGRHYRSLEYRMSCAQLQWSRYKRDDMAAKIVEECLRDIEHGALQVSPESLAPYGRFMKEIRLRQRMNRVRRVIPLLTSWR